MPTLDEIYGVPVRTPIRMNLDAYAQALNKIDQRDLAAREQMSKINAGLANIKAQLNVADYDWFDNYTNSIISQINQEASYGSYANALNKAVELGGTYAQDSGLLARIKANQDWETKKKEIQARADSRDISQTTAQRWLAQNNYSFDENTQKLKQYKDPVSTVDYTKMYNLVNALALSKTTQEDRAAYLDKEGNITNDFTKAVGTLNHQQRTQFRSRKSLEDVFKSVMKSYGDAYSSLVQDLEDKKWQLEEYDKQINNAVTEQEKNDLILKRDFIKSEITNSNGIIMTPKEYLAARSDAVLDNLRINDVIINNSLTNPKNGSGSGGSMTDNEIGKVLGVDNSYEIGKATDNVISVPNINSYIIHSCFGL